MIHYSEKILQHFYHPKQVGRFKKGEHAIFSSEIKNGTAEILSLQIKVNDKQVIEEARFLAHGGVAMIAICSMLCEWLAGKSMAEASSLTSQQIMQWCELPEVKRHCALLAEDLLKQLLKNYAVGVTAMM